MRVSVKILMAVLLLTCSAASAHDARPVVIVITEQLPGALQFVIRVPDTVEVGNQPSVAWPAGCIEQNAQTAFGASTGSVLCDASLHGKSLALSFPYFNPSLATFYRYSTFDGQTMTAMLSPTTAEWNVPLEPTAGNVAREYLTLGVEHIIGGLDHLLFVLGLLVIARTLKRILWTVTGFTVAHSITLTLSALGFINIPIVPVEAVIALSIVFLAHEISRGGGNRHIPESLANSLGQAHEKTRAVPNNASLTYRYPLLVSFGFGLLHGLGFASALGEIGLVENEILVSLLFFNLGVEAGQIAFILVVVALLWSLRLVFRKQTVFSEVITARRVDLLAAYVIGIPASYWLVDRVAQFMI
jgi:hypothetical protein